MFFSTVAMARITEMLFRRVTRMQWYLLLYTRHGLGMKTVRNWKRHLREYLQNVDLFFEASSCFFVLSLFLYFVIPCDFHDN